METEFYIERQILFWRLLIPIPEIPIDKLTVEMLSCCVEQPLQAIARLAVFSLPDSISFPILSISISGIGIKNCPQFMQTGSFFMTVYLFSSEAGHRRL